VSWGLRAATLTAMLLATAGCTPPGGSPPESSPSRTSLSCAKPDGSVWATYSDAIAGFTVSYPPGFTLQLQHNPVTGLVESYRAVESCYLKVSPPGQLELTVYTKDADSLAGWVNNHTGSPAFISGTDQYFSGVSNQAPARVAGRDAMGFDWQPDAAPFTVHNTALFLGAAHVLVLGWWAEDAPGLPDAEARATYFAALHADYKEMLADLHLD